MIVLAGIHGHHAFAAWPFLAVIGVLLVVATCAAILLLTRPPRSAAEVPAAGSRWGYSAHSPDWTGRHATEGIVEKRATPVDPADLDARILAMLRQKGEPMPQPEIEANLGMHADSLGPRLADMERRAMLRRTWDPEQSTYMVDVSTER